MSGSRDLSGFGSPADHPPASRPSPPKPAGRRRSATPPARRSAGSKRPDRPTTRPATTPTTTGDTAAAATGTPPTNRASSPDHKRRINLSLPVAVADGLRRFTESQNTFYLDVVVRAHALHRERARLSLQPESGPPPLRRRKPAGRVQVALTMPADALVALDRDAASLDVDRSTYVTELLTAFLREVDDQHG